MQKEKKHAKHMTTDEAVEHLFHPTVMHHAKEHAHKGIPMPVIEKKKPKRAPK
jgi:hypothetical protein